MPSDTRRNVDYHRLTAAQLVVVAADVLTSVRQVAEFTEWDLTVTIWTLDKKRFGMRGYEELHPDHKRLYMEITGAKKNTPVNAGYLAKVYPNVYKLTELGKAEALRLNQGGGGLQPQNRRTDLYANLEAVVTHPAFISWCNNPDTPRTFGELEPFLKLNGELEQINKLTTAGLDYCEKHGVLFITPNNGARGRPPIHVSKLSELKSFQTVMRYRFERQLQRSNGRA